MSWFVNLDYAVQQGLKFYIAGWTDPEVKAQLGAKFTFTRHLVWIQQPALRYVLGKFKHLFEADAHNQKTRLLFSNSDLDADIAGLSVPIHFSSKDAPYVLMLLASKNRFEFINLQKLIEILQDNAQQI